MDSHKKEIRKFIKINEEDIFRRKFPKKLCDYIFYELDGYDPWPYGFSEDEMYSQVQNIAASFFDGTLDTTMKEPLVLAEDHIHYLRDIYGDAMREQARLELRIQELEKELRKNGIRIVSTYDIENNGYVDKYYKFDDPEYLKLTEHFNTSMNQEKLPFKDS